MINIPQTIATETADALNTLLHESDRFRDSTAEEIQTLLQAVKRLQKVDAAEAFIRFGSIAAICADVDGVLEYYRKALLLPREPDTKHEFWVSMGNAGMYSKAQELGSWLLDPKRGFFQKVWQRAVGMGQILEVWACLADAKKTYPELSQVDFSAVESAATVMKARGLSDRDMVSVLELMGAIQRAHRIMYYGSLVSNLRVMRPSNDPEYLYLAMPLDVSVDEIHAMNRELAKRVVERLPEGVFPQGMVASFAKAYPIALRVAA